VERNKILKLSNTRWLVLHKCIVRLLDNWDVLKNYFVLAVVEDKLKSAEIILNQLNDNFIKAYILFLKYSLNFLTPRMGLHLGVVEGLMVASGSTRLRGRVRPTKRDPQAKVLIKPCRRLRGAGGAASQTVPPDTGRPLGYLAKPQPFAALVGRYRASAVLVG